LCFFPPLPVFFRPPISLIFCPAKNLPFRGLLVFLPTLAYRAVRFLRMPPLRFRRVNNPHVKTSFPSVPGVPFFHFFSTPLLRLLRFFGRCSTSVFLPRSSFPFPPPFALSLADCCYPRQISTVFLPFPSEFFCARRFRESNHFLFTV